MFEEICVKICVQCVKEGTEVALGINVKKMKDMKAKKKNQENKRLHFLKSVLPLIEYNQQVRTFGNFNEVSKI